MIRAEMPFKSSLVDRGIAPPALVLTGRTTNDAGGARISVTLTIAGLPARRLEDLQDALMRRLELGGAGLLTLLAKGETRGRPVLSLCPVEVPPGERQPMSRRQCMMGPRPGHFTRRACTSPCWPGGPTGEKIRQLRGSRHITYRDLAAALAIDVNKVASWERGEKIVPRKMRHLLLKTLGLDKPSPGEYTEAA